MENDKFNICISFSYKGEPYGLCFHTSTLYIKPNKEKFDKDDLYMRNEPLVRGDIQLLLSSITNKIDRLFLKNIEVIYDGKVVYEASEYEVWHIPPMNK